MRDNPPTIGDQDIERAIALAESLLHNIGLCETVGTWQIAIGTPRGHVAIAHGSGGLDVPNVHEIIRVIKDAEPTQEWAAILASGWRGVKLCYAMVSIAPERRAALLRRYGPIFYLPGPIRWEVVERESLAIVGKTTCANSGGSGGGCGPEYARALWENITRWHEALKRTGGISI